MPVLEMATSEETQYPLYASCPATGVEKGVSAQDPADTNIREQARELRSKRDFARLLTRFSGQQQLVELKVLRAEPLAERHFGMMDPYRHRLVVFCTAVRQTFNGFDFTGSQFHHVDFFGSSFTGCKLSDCVFADCNLWCCTFTDCELAGTVFAEQPIKHVAFQKGSDLSSSRFHNVVFESASVGNAKRFAYAELENVTFRDCDLSYLDLRGAKLKKIVIHDSCKTEGLTITPSQVAHVITNNGQGINAIEGVLVEELPPISLKAEWTAIKFAADYVRLARILFNSFGFSFLIALAIFLLGATLSGPDFDIRYGFYAPFVIVWTLLLCLVSIAYVPWVKRRWRLWRPILDNSDRVGL